MTLFLKEAICALIQVFFGCWIKCLTKTVDIKLIKKKDRAKMFVNVHLLVP